MRGRSNLSSRRLALSVSTSSTLNDFINKKLGVKKDENNSSKKDQPSRG